MLAFKTQFTLSKEYLTECFNESLPHGKSRKNNYLFAGLTLCVGAALLFFTGQPKIVGTLLIALGVLELVHIRFQRAWWLFRQMWSRSANAQIDLSINDQTIETRNPFTETTLFWDDVSHVIETELGLILVAKTGGQQYLSKSLFSDDVVRDILAKK